MSTIVEHPVSTEVPVPRLPAGLPTVPIYRLSVEQYHQMIATGLFADDEALELLEGWLVPKMSKNPPHTFYTDLLQQLLREMLPAGWVVRAQDPITLEDSEPEPDVVIAQGERRDFKERHPGAGEIPLVIEVAHTTQAIDRGIKRRLYARAAIPQYWIVDLADQRVEVYTEPMMIDGEPTYASRADFLKGRTLPVILFGETFGQVLIDEVVP